MQSSFYPDGECDFTCVIFTLTCMEDEGHCGLSTKTPGTPKEENCNCNIKFQLSQPQPEKIQTSRK